MKRRLNQQKIERIKLAEGIFRLCHLITLRNRIQTNLPGVKLKLTERQLLNEIDAHPGHDLAYFAKLMNLNQSSISRLVAKLVRDKYLLRKESADDRRKMVLGLTQKGLQTLNLIDRQNEKILKQNCADFSLGELKQFENFLIKFSDGFGQSRSISRRNEHPLRVEQRRIIRSLNLLEGSSDSNTAKRIPRLLLMLLAESHRSLSASEIADLLSMQRSATSVLLGRMGKEKLIRFSQNTNDHRSVSVGITVAGSDWLENAERHMIAQCEKALQVFSLQDLRSFVTLLRLFAGEPRRVELHKHFSIKAVQSAVDRRKAREFYLKQIAKSGDWHAVPERLFDSNCVAMALLKGSELVAVAQAGEGIEAFASALSPSQSGYEKAFLRVIE